MSQWPSPKAKRVLAALLKLGWETRRQTGSHRTLVREGWSDFVFAFHDGEARKRCTSWPVCCRPNGAEFTRDLDNASQDTIEFM